MDNAGVLYSVIGYSGTPAYPLRLFNSIVDSLVYMIAHIALAYALMYFVMPRYLLKQKYWLTAMWVMICFLGAASISTIFGGIAASIKLMKHCYLKEQRNLQLQKENVEAQLQLLKAQVHRIFYSTHLITATHIRKIWRR